MFTSSATIFDSCVYGPDFSGDFICVVVEDLINIWTNSSGSCPLYSGIDVISRRSVIQNSGKQMLKPNRKWSSFSQLFSEVCFSALQLTLRSTLIPKHQSSPSQNLCASAPGQKMEKGQTVPQLSKRSMPSYQL